MLALGVIGSGTFGLGLYVNQMRIYEEKLNVYDEKINAVRMEARKDTAIAEEKIKSVKIEAEKEALQLLYNIFTQEEYKEAKKKMLAQKSKWNHLSDVKFA